MRRPLVSAALAVLAYAAVIGLDASGNPVEAGYRCGYWGCSYHRSYRHHWYRSYHWRGPTYYYSYSYMYPRHYSHHYYFRHSHHHRHHHWW